MKKLLLIAILSGGFGFIGLNGMEVKPEKIERYKDQLFLCIAQNLESKKKGESCNDDLIRKIYLDAIEMCGRNNSTCILSTYKKTFEKLGLPTN